MREDEVAALVERMAALQAELGDLCVRWSRLVHQDTAAHTTEPVVQPSPLLGVEPGESEVL